jgi:hypothetical protein
MRAKLVRVMLHATELRGRMLRRRMLGRYAAIV